LATNSHHLVDRDLIVVGNFVLNFFYIRRWFFLGFEEISLYLFHISCYFNLLVID
jgi:hypothetical protein